jgi:hypothetical protein
LSLNSQSYFGLPNGRILRVRFNVSRGISDAVSVRDVSVYGTERGFRGRARLGRTLLIDNSWEYSVSRSWVLALDALWSRSENTRVVGRNALDPRSAAGSIRLDSGERRRFGLAPAVEYSWTPNLGVLLGVRVLPAADHASRSITPAVALNFVH